MTVRGLLLALALLGASPVDSAALCHRYAVWRFPWPQSCAMSRSPLRVRHEATFVALAHHRPSRPATIPEKLPNFGKDIPIPFLDRADCVGGEADEATRARVMLRAALENAHAD